MARKGIFDEYLSGGFREKLSFGKRFDELTREEKARLCRIVGYAAAVVAFISLITFIRSLS